MDTPKLPEPSLLKSVLEPLLDDFQYWFERSRTLLERETIDFLGEEAQADLLARVTQAQEEVSASQMLLEATGCQAGVEMSVLMPWHNLLAECWKVSSRLRMEQSN
ncbi:MAG: DUF2605 domain-containing protein [Geitlerinemataceae cyanobacterium]